MFDFSCFFSSSSTKKETAHINITEPHCAAVASIDDFILCQWASVCRAHTQTHRHKFIVAVLDFGLLFSLFSLVARKCWAYCIAPPLPKKITHEFARSQHIRICLRFIVFRPYFFHCACVGVGAAAAAASGVCFWKIRHNTPTKQEKQKTNERGKKYMDFCLAFGRILWSNCAHLHTQTLTNAQQHFVYAYG